MSIRTRFAIAIATTVSATVVALVALIGVVASWMIQQTHDLSLQREATRVAALIRAETAWVGNGVCKFAISPACTFVLDINTPEGRNGEGLTITAEHKALTEPHSAGELWNDDMIDNRRVRVLTVALDDGRALMVASSASAVDRAIERLRLLLLVSGAGVVAAAAAVSTAVAGRLARPIRELTRAADRVSTVTQTSERLVLDRSDEIGRLAEAMNQMLNRLQAAEEARRTLISDASHDLRSPLTAISSHLQLLKRHDLDETTKEAILEDTREDAHDMARLIQTISDLARAESHPLHIVDLQPDELVREAVATTQRRWRSVAVFIVATSQSGPTWPGDEELVSRALVNVMDNAAKYSPSGGRVLVTTGQNHNEWWVEVTDSGFGIRSEDLDHVFDRFYRGTALDTHTAGSGLGLAMVKQTAERHGGCVTIASVPARGTRVRLVFRRPPAPTTKEGIEGT